MEINSDAVRWSAPERERAGRPLLVLMHGYLSHEGDLFGLSPLMPLGPVIASLRAPITLETGFAWFPIPDNATAAEQFEAANESARAVLSWLDTVQATSVGLLGFSQGGAMALQLMRHAPDRFAYAVQLSGFALPGELAGDDGLAARKPPVFWGRGTARRGDPGARDRVHQRLAAASTPPSRRTSTRMSPTRSPSGSCRMSADSSARIWSDPAARPPGPVAPGTVTLSEARGKMDS